MRRPSVVTIQACSRSSLNSISPLNTHSPIVACSGRQRRRNSAQGLMPWPCRGSIHGRHLDIRTVMAKRDEDAVISRRWPPIEQDLKPTARAAIAPQHTGGVTRRHVAAHVVLRHRDRPRAIEWKESGTFGSRPKTSTADGGSGTDEESGRDCEGNLRDGHGCLRKEDVHLEALNGAVAVRVSLRTRNTSWRCKDSAVIALV